MSDQGTISTARGATSSKDVSPRLGKAVKATRAGKGGKGVKNVQVTKAPRASKAVKATTSSRTARAAKAALPPLGPDIDLDVEEVYLADGTRLTEARAEQLSEQVMEAHYKAIGRPFQGRPSLSGGRQHTPNLTVRVTAATREALEVIAERQGRRLSDVSRDALDEYARRHAGEHRAAGAAELEAELAELKRAGDGLGDG